MSSLKSERGGVVFELLFLSVFIAFFIIVLEQVFHISRSSMVSSVLNNDHIDRELKEMGWPVCLEDHFESKFSARPVSGRGYIAAGDVVLFVDQICKTL